MLIVPDTLGQPRAVAVALHLLVALSWPSECMPSLRQRLLGTHTAGVVVLAHLELLGVEFHYLTASTFSPADQQRDEHPGSSYFGTPAKILLEAAVRQLLGLDHIAQTQYLVGQVAVIAFAGLGQLALDVLQAGLASPVPAGAYPAFACTTLGRAVRIEPIWIGGPSATVLRTLQDTHGFPRLLDAVRELLQPDRMVPHHGHRAGADVQADDLAAAEEYLAGATPSCTSCTNQRRLEPCMRHTMRQYLVLACKQACKYGSLVLVGSAPDITKPLPHETVAVSACQRGPAALLLPSMLCRGLCLPLKRGRPRVPKAYSCNDANTRLAIFWVS